MKAPFRVLTPRLELLRPSASDAGEIFSRYASDPDVVTFLGWPRHLSVDDTRAFLASSEDQWMRFPAGPYLVRSREDGRLLGGTGFAFGSPGEAATGYVLAKDEWGRGYATEALHAVVDLAPAIGVVRLYAFCHPDHLASRRVLEKCRFVRDERTYRFEFPNLAPGVQQKALRYVRLFGASITPSAG